MLTGATKQLPRYASVFVGRAREVRLLEEAIGAGRHLLTITGPAGVGESRLANQLAATSDLPAWWFDLGSAEDESGIVAAVGRALGVPLTGRDPTDRIQRLGHVLAALGRGLFVFDRFEHLLASVAVLQSWVALAGEGVFVVTSRTRHRLHGEWCLLLEPLSEADAVELVIDRSRAEGASGSPDATAMAEIVRRVDGLPLAIELCASRLGMLGPKQLLDLLSQRVDLLAGAGHMDDPLHATLRRTLDWSWNLLAPAEKRALARCSVFRGGFDLDAAGAVLELSPFAVLDTLRSLHDASLLRAYEVVELQGERRYGLLDIVHEYVDAKLDELEGERARAQTLHASHFAERARRSSRTAAGLVIEKGNLLVVHDRTRRREHTSDEERGRWLDVCVALGALYAAHGPADEYVAIADAVLARSDGPLQAARRAGVLAARGRTYIISGRQPDAMADFTRALELAESASDRATQAWCLSKLGICQRSVHAEGLAAFERALELLVGLHEPYVEASCLHEYGVFLHTQGDGERAGTLYKRALACFHAIGSVDDEARVLVSLATLCLGRCQLDEGRDAGLRALHMAREVGERNVEVRALTILAAIAQDEGRWSDARDAITSALAIEHFLGLLEARAWSLFFLARLCLEDGRPAEAISALQESVGQLAASSQGTAFAALGAALARVGRLDDASTSFACAAVSMEALDRPACERVLLDLLRCHLDIARATAGQDGPRAKLLSPDDVRLAGVRELLERTEHAIHVGEGQDDEVRWAYRLLRASFDAATSTGLVVDRSGDWFELAGGEHVDLSRRRPLRLLLVRLVEERARAPGTPVATRSLIAIAWPGEQITESAASSRLRVALSSLRKLGLGPALKKKSDGYLLDPDLPTRWAASASS